MSEAEVTPAQERLLGREVFDARSRAAASAVAKRAYDIFFSLCGLLLLAPLFLVIAALIKAADCGPVFFRQLRVGLHGRPFLIWKFRTMLAQADQAGPLVTRGGDRRITGIGRLLRKTKLDELPQLWNVLRGEMSLVGPRPEVRPYVERYTPEQRKILNLKPGITDLASLHFRNEESLLKNADNLEEFYIRHCIPRKLQLNLEYAREANLLTDTWIILQTICPYWIGMLSVYSVVLAASFSLSCAFVYDFSFPPRLRDDFFGTMFTFLAVQLGALIWRKQCKGLLSYFSLPELRQLTTALGFAGLLLLSSWAFAHRVWPPRNLILVDMLLSLCALSAFRLLLRFWREGSSWNESALNQPALRVGIVGAGPAGSRILRQLSHGSGRERTVVAFFDDDCQKWQRRIHEVPVVGMPESLLDGWAGKLDEVIIAIPDTPPQRLGEIQRLLRRTDLRVYAAPLLPPPLNGDGTGSSPRFRL